MLIYLLTRNKLALSPAVGLLRCMSDSPDNAFFHNQPFLAEATEGRHEKHYHVLLVLIHREMTKTAIRAILFLFLPRKIPLASHSSAFSSMIPCKIPQTVAEKCKVFRATHHIAFMIFTHCRYNDQVSRLQEMLEAKQLQLRKVLSGGGEGKTGPTAEEKQLEQQREEYGRRGIRYVCL